MDKKRRRKRKKKQQVPMGFVAIFVAVLLIIIAGSVVGIRKYAPSKERMELSDYYILTKQDEAAVIMNGSYDPDAPREASEAIAVNGTPFLRVKYLKTNIDDGYVYDMDEGVLRYVTDTEVITAKRGDLRYEKGTSGRDIVDFSAEIIVERDGEAFINADFAKLFSDFDYRFEANPNRVMLETAGSQKIMTTLSKNAPLRRFGGPKSRILKDGIKGEPVQILEDYGKWTAVVTEDGVIGCVKNNQLGKSEEVTVDKRLPERTYTHNLLDKKVNMVWHGVYSIAANESVSEALSNTQGVNVICPTWYRISDNQGNVSSMGSTDYVNTCHNAGIEVWGMVSNFEVEGVDSTMILNHTSSRDNLVNSLVSAAIRDNIDGLNIDFEALSIEAKDGFIEFIKELSLKCKSNDLILSVSNYKPEAHTSFYNRTVQAQYADYIMVMAYDEYHGDAVEPGSNSSMPFVRECIDDSLAEVPKEQLILALPFYTRIWTTEGANLTNKSYGMAEVARIIESNNAEKVWLSDKEQYYAKYEKNGRINEIWVEDEESLSRKLDLGKKKGIAGYAFWKIGMEPKSIWDVIVGYIN